jgi:hypothetical protein
MSHTSPNIPNRNRARCRCYTSRGTRPIAATTSTLAIRPARTSPSSPTGSEPLRPEPPTPGASQLPSTGCSTSRPAPRPKPPAGSQPSLPPCPQTARSTPARSDTSTTGCNTPVPQQLAVHDAGRSPGWPELRGPLHTGRMRTGRHPPNRRGGTGAPRVVRADGGGCRIGSPPRPDSCTDGHQPLARTGLPPPSCV